MNVIRTIHAFRAARRTLAGPVGLVPTMGYLHEGHLTLVREARSRSTSVVVSIFVNPSQFAPSEDLESYPRDLERDVALLEEEDVDLVFIPEVDQVYPEGFDTWVHVEALASRLEGAERPTHFRGVTTIVTKLFHIVQPDLAVFGQKDAQQALVIHRMCRDLDFPVDLVVAPTVREPDGLAMSSRNAYLSEDERRAATVLYRSLQSAKAMYADGERDAKTIREALLSTLGSERLVSPLYVSVADVNRLEELDSIEGKALVSLAARVGTARLIDNVILPPGEGLIG